MRAYHKGDTCGAARDRHEARSTKADANGIKRVDLCYTSAQNHWHRSKTDMATTLRWTSADLENLPHNGNRYEIIDGELIVSKQPHYYHQLVCSNAIGLLAVWSRGTNLGEPN